MVSTDLADGKSVHGQLHMLERSHPATANCRSRRQARYRWRQAAGRIVVTLELGPEETAKLHRLHYLQEFQLEDRRAIAGALRALLANILIE
jgi:hypothetical protein